MGTDTLTMPLPGDLIATHSPGVVGALIRFGEKRAAIGWRRAVWHTVTKQIDTPDDPWYFNHIAVYVGSGILIEAEARGLTQSPLTKYREFKVLPLGYAHVYPQTVEVTNMLRFAWAEERNRDPYGWLSIASIVVNLLTPLKLSISWADAVICSAFGARCWEHAGVIVKTPVLTTMPSDLVEMVK